MDKFGIQFAQKHLDYKRSTTQHVFALILQLLAFVSLMLVVCKCRKPFVNLFSKKEQRL